MRPRSPRWIALAGALAAASSAGCQPPGARTFAVVLAEPEYIDCFPHYTTIDAPTEAVTQLYSALVTSWRSSWDAGNLRPTGGSLRLVHHQGRTLAWLDDLRPGQYQQWNGVVLEGEPQDGYVQLTHVVSHDTQQDDCGVDGIVIDTSSELLATVDGGEIEGRIRRTERLHFSSPSSVCAAYVECARNIALFGSEDP